MKTNLHLWIVVLITNALGAFAQGTLVIDQQSTLSPPSADVQVPIQGNTPIGQSFTPSLNSIGYIQLSTHDNNLQNGLGATITLNLRTNSITGPILGSTDPLFIPDSSTVLLSTFYFGRLVALSPGI